MEDIREGTVVTDKEEAEREQAEFDEIEKSFCQKVGPKGQNVPYRLVWLGLESMRCENQWRPVRNVDAKVLIQMVTFTFRSVFVLVSCIRAIQNVYYLFIRAVSAVQSYFIQEEISVRHRVFNELMRIQKVFYLRQKLNQSNVLQTESTL